MVISTDLHYFGSIHYIQQIMKSGAVHFKHDQSYTKMSFKNRMIIGTAQGPLHLSIPIIGGRDQKTPVKEIKIAYTSPWNEIHYKSIVSNYRRSPYFEYYHDEIDNLYKNKPELLVDFLMPIHEWINNKIKGNWEITTVNSIEQVDYTDPWLPKNYDQIPNPIIYQQVFEDKIGFMPNLSILDLLFCCGGKQAKQLLSAI